MDTNVVHFTRLYLSLAQKHHLPPYGGNLSDLKDDLKRICSGSNRTLQNYELGSKLYQEFVKMSNEGWQIKYSRFTRFELACGGLRGKAVENALGEQMPYRWWNRMREDEVLDRLAPSTYEEVNNEVDNIEALFKSAEIVIEEFDVHQFPDVFQMAKALLALVFLDIGDCIVYAGALIEEADEIWTDDGYLKMVVNSIENPSAAKPHRRTYFEEVNKKVIDGLNKILSIDPSDPSTARLPVRLPKARSH